MFWSTASASTAALLLSTLYWIPPPPLIGFYRDWTPNFEWLIWTRKAGRDTHINKYADKPSHEMYCSFYNYTVFLKKEIISNMSSCPSDGSAHIKLSLNSSEDALMHSFYFQILDGPYFMKQQLKILIFHPSLVQEKCWAYDFWNIGGGGVPKIMSS